MPRGITQDQVKAVADAILGTGENPTLGKVRAAWALGHRTPLRGYWTSEAVSRVNGYTSSAHCGSTGTCGVGDDEAVAVGHRTCQSGNRRALCQGASRAGH